MDRKELFGRQLLFVSLFYAQDFCAQSSAEARTLRCCLLWLQEGDPCPLHRTQRTSERACWCVSAPRPGVWLRRRWGENGACAFKAPDCLSLFAAERLTPSGHSGHLSVCGAPSWRISKKKKKTQLRFFLKEKTRCCSQRVGKSRSSSRLRRSALLLRLIVS